MQQVPPESIDFWCAYDEEYPLNQQDDQWIQHARQMMMLWQVYAAQLAANGIEATKAEMDDWLPERLRSKKPVVQSASDIERQLTSRFGL